jgi:GNAT superfamily N-acetyltransferase
LQLTATQKSHGETRLSFKSRGASGHVDLTYGPAPAVADWAWERAGYSRGEKFGEATDVVAFICWMSVTPAERGWGTRLLNAVLDWLRGRGVMRVYLNPVADDDDAQDRLIAFYERAGFEEIEREEIYGDTPVVLMEALL